MSKQPLPTLPPKPEAPLPGDCCDSGCSPCVYDLYYEELSEWEAKVKRLKAAADESEQGQPQAGTPG